MTPDNNYSDSTITHPPFLTQLSQTLNDRADHHLLRSLHPIDSASTPEISLSGKHLLQFSSNNYLGLTTHPNLIAAATNATQRFGTGSGASRLVAGSLSPHHELEHALAQFEHTDAALLFPTGYMANLAVLTTLAQEGDLIVSDKLNHASLIDAARFSGATLRTFPHRQYSRAETLITRSENIRRKFLVTDSVFSMDGDLADLPALAMIARHHNTILIIDEAHGTGVLGKRGAGLAEFQNVEGFVNAGAIKIGTLSKALGSVGGFVAARKLVIDTLINSARPFIYTTALPPACAAAAHAALKIVEREPERRQHLLALADRLRTELRALGLNTGDSASPIIPIILGDPATALAASAALLDHGIFIPAIRPPTVPPNSARLRISLMATHAQAHIDRLLETLRTLQKQGRLPTEEPSNQESKVKKQK